MADRRFQKRQALDYEIKEIYVDGTFDADSGSYPAGTTSGLVAEITYTSATIGPSRNADTITIQVAAAAANPTDTILADITGDEDAVVITITPNDGTNNPVNVAPSGTTSGLVSEITYTSATKGTTRNADTITIQVLAAAANPTDTILAAITGTIDAVVVTVTPNDGTNNAATPVDLTTAELAELVSNGTVVGKTVTVTDSSSLLDDLSATGGDTTVLVDGGEGDAVAATLSGGTDVAVDLTTAELAELVSNGSVAAKTVTVTDASSLLDDLSAVGGDTTVLADGGEGDAVAATLANGAIGNPTINSSLGVASISREAAGSWRITLKDNYVALRSFAAVLLDSTKQDIKFQLDVNNVGSSKIIDMYTTTVATATDPAEDSKFFVKIELKNSSIGE